MEHSLASKTEITEPLTEGEVQSELLRLCTGKMLLKQAVFSDILFPLLEKHFKSSIDKEASVPFVPNSHLYMSDEGFITVFSVVYTLSRFASKDLVLSAEKEGECVFLNLRGKMDHKAKNVEEALGAPSKWMALLSKIAGASGFSLFASVIDGRLEARFRFSRFRAVPVSSYSCSEQFVVDKVQRAFKLFTLFP